MGREGSLTCIPHAVCIATSLVRISCEGCRKPCTRERGGFFFWLGALEAGRSLVQMLDNGVVV